MSFFGIGKKGLDIDSKVLEKERDIRIKMIDVCKHPDWKYIAETLSDDLDALVNEQKDALSKKEIEKALFIGGEIRRLWKIINLSRDSEIDLNMLNNEIEQSKSEVKNG
jgi:hypothetical protein